MTSKMFFTFALILFIGSGLFFYFSRQEPTPTNSTSVASDVYTCPMHPSVISDRQGACPVCGMALVRKSGGSQSSQHDLAMLESVSLSPSQRVMANVSTTRVTSGSLDREINAVGIVDIFEPSQSTITARFRGRIQRLFVGNTGTVVSKGQPLFELYSPDLLTAQSEYLLAVEAVKNAAEAMGNAADYEQLERSARIRLEHQFGMTEAQIHELLASRQSGSTVTFLSPEGGTVILKGVQEGQYVQEGDILYQLADLGTISVYLDVYAKDMSSLRLNQVVEVTEESMSGEQYEGVVTFIDPTINPETRTARVRAEFKNREGKLKPQSYVRATIRIPQESGLLIPTTAILYTGKRTMVWVEVETNRFEPREVSAGVSSGGLTRILEGLEEDETIAVTGAYLLDSESQLQRSIAPPRNQPAEGKSDSTGHSSGSGVKEIRITVDGSYSPDLIHVKRGEPTVLIFDRKDRSRCTDELVIEELGIHQDLARESSTRIEITPERAGEFRFTCGMKMVEGTMVVHD